MYSIFKLEHLAQNQSKLLQFNALFSFLLNILYIYLDQISLIYIYIYLFTTRINLDFSFNFFHLLHKHIFPYYLLCLSLHAISAQIGLISKQWGYEKSITFTSSTFLFSWTTKRQKLFTFLAFSFISLSFPLSKHSVKVYTNQ